VVTATEKEGDWISLMDYATKYGVSLSTLRRHIKANKIQYRVEDGRYLLRSPFASTPVARSTESAHGSGAVSATFNNAQDLQLSLYRAQEEITELKMLVALYEDQLSR
jgi:hypothetical protein